MASPSHWCWVAGPPGHSWAGSAAGVGAWGPGPGAGGNGQELDRASKRVTLGLPVAPDTRHPERQGAS